MSEKVQILVQAFLTDIVRRVEEDVRQRLEAALGDIFVGKTVPKAAKAAIAKAKPETRRTIKRKKPPKQYCPVPGCKNVAAPIFGMVCGEHKNVAKSKIAKYRLARKKAKVEVKTSKMSVAKKPAAKKSVAKKPVAKKHVAKKTVAKKPVAKKHVAKKTVAKKPAVKKPTSKKPMSKKSLAKKPVVKTKAEKKPTARAGAMKASADYGSRLDLGYLSNGGSATT